MIDLHDFLLDALVIVVYNTIERCERIGELLMIAESMKNGILAGCAGSSGGSRRVMLDWQVADDDCGLSVSNHSDERRMDFVRAEQAIADFLTAMGEDPSREGLQDTPGRVVRMYRELFAGLEVDPAQHLSRTFDEPYDEIVLLRDIQFSSLCEHHLLPFMGKAHVAYLPDDRVVGLSKLARTVEAYARRPQVQERLTSQVADALMTHLNAKGALVVVESEHLCMKIRGVNQPCSRMITSAVRGVFKQDAAARAEAFALLKQ